MKIKKLFYILSFFIITLFLYQCGGRYEPELFPDKVKNPNVISRERRVIVENNEDLNVEMKKVEEEAIDTDEPDNIFQKGIASWYGGKFQGRRTANGEIYDKYKLTAAHKTLPFNSIVEVVNQKNNRKVIVRINDRGPFVKGRIIDLSKKAANMIGMEESGTAPVSLAILNKDALNKIHKTTVFVNSRKGEQSSPDQTAAKQQESEKVRFEQTEPEPEQWFYIQAGAFQDRINAERVLNKIRRVTDIGFSIKKNNGFYKVISVKLSPRTLAEKISSDLKEYYIDTFVKSF